MSCLRLRHKSVRLRHGTEHLVSLVVDEHWEEQCIECRISDGEMIMCAAPPLPLSKEDDRAVIHDRRG